MRRAIVVATVFGLLAASGTARAWVHEGEAAPGFTKRVLAGGPPWSYGATVSLSDYAGQVVVIFLLGYS